MIKPHICQIHLFTGDTHKQTIALLSGKTSCNFRGQMQKPHVVKKCYRRHTKQTIGFNIHHSLSKKNDQKLHI